MDWKELIAEDIEDNDVLMAAVEGIMIVHSFQAMVPRRKRDHRTLPRKKKRVFQHQRAADSIRHDFTGPDALFIGKDFKSCFRISRARFQNLLETFGNSGKPFYSGKADCCRNPTASLEARLLLPLQCLAFGVPSHAFCMYYQMSRTLAAKACREFNHAYLSLYRNKYLKMPDQQDMLNIAELHKKVHGVSGMFGSLDCMHTQWKNCPLGWQGSFKGRAGYPSIVLEAACDYNCYFWHLDYGHAGTNNDVNVLQASDFYQSFLDGRMEELEKDVVPFTISGEVFQKMFVLTDGAYPQFDRFVKPQRFPILAEERKFMDWQSASRKDIERAFGILQCQWQAIARPIQLHSIKEVSTMVKCCLCLHNMCVSDRVMNGDFAVRYKPTNVLAMPTEGPRVAAVAGPGTAIGLASTRTINPMVYQAVTRSERFKRTTDKAQCQRLRQALIDSFKTNNY